VEPRISDNNTKRIGIAMQFTARKIWFKRELYLLIGRVPNQSSNSGGKIAKAIIWDIRHSQGKEVGWRPKGNINPSVLWFG
jgi:hypothetical protein